MGIHLVLQLWASEGRKQVEDRDAWLRRVLDALRDSGLMEPDPRQAPTATRSLARFEARLRPPLDLTVYIGIPPERPLRHLSKAKREIAVRLRCDLEIDLHKVGYRMLNSPGVFEPEVQQLESELDKARRSHDRGLVFHLETKKKELVDRQARSFADALLRLMEVLAAAADARTVQLLDDASDDLFPFAYLAWFPGIGELVDELRFAGQAIVPWSLAGELGIRPETAVRLEQIGVGDVRRALNDRQVSVLPLDQGIVLSGPDLLPVRGAPFGSVLAALFGTLSQELSTPR